MKEEGRGWHPDYPKTYTHKLICGIQTLIFSLLLISLAGGGQAGAPNTREHIHLKKQYTKLQEENNLLKYKVELLLDMLAASSADCLVLQKELEAVKKPPAAHRTGKR